MKKICIVVPYFGKWPAWMHLYLASCGRNSTIDWIFITDCRPPHDAPANVRFQKMEWRGCAELIRDRCRVRNGPAKPYKLCDFRFAFGDVFREYFEGYHYWGFGDIDVIYGNVRAFLTSDVLDHDLITFSEAHVSGHLTFLRNTRELAEKYQSSEQWRRKIERREYQFLDENNGHYGIENVYAKESYSTPLSPYQPWTNGKFVFPGVWYYADGRLFNSLDGSREFMYLHFMRYKYIWWAHGLKSVVHVPPDGATAGFKLLVDGFHSYVPGDERATVGDSISVRPFRTGPLRKLLRLVFGPQLDNYMMGRRAMKGQRA